MGQVYGESKKHDQMVVGSSTNLRPKSDVIKNAFEQTLRQTASQSSPPPVPMTPPVNAPVTVPPPALIPLPGNVPLQPQTDPAQLEFDLRELSKLDKVIELLQRQNTLLVDIKNSLNNKKDIIKNNNAKNTIIKGSV